MSASAEGIHGVSDGEAGGVMSRAKVIAVRVRAGFAVVALIAIVVVFVLLASGVFTREAAGQPVPVFDPRTAPFTVPLFAILFVAQIVLEAWRGVQEKGFLTRAFIHLGINVVFTVVALGLFYAGALFSAEVFDLYRLPADPELRQVGLPLFFTLVIVPIVAIDSISWFVRLRPRRRRPRPR